MGLTFWYSFFSSAFLQFHNGFHNSRRRNCCFGKNKHTLDYIWKNVCSVTMLATVSDVTEWMAAIHSWLEKLWFVVAEKKSSVWRYGPISPTSWPSWDQGHKQTERPTFPRWFDRRLSCCHVRMNNVQEREGGHSVHEPDSPVMLCRPGHTGQWWGITLILFLFCEGRWGIGRIM